VVFFNRAMEKFYRLGDNRENFARFEKAAQKGYAPACWVVQAAEKVFQKNLEEDNDDAEAEALKEAFSGGETGGWGLLFAGLLSSGMDRLEFFKKSAEAGNSWGQAHYATFFTSDGDVYLDWLEKAAAQDNPLGLSLMGQWVESTGGEHQQEKALSYYRRSALLGWENAMMRCGWMYRHQEGCLKDLYQSGFWYAQCMGTSFAKLLQNAKKTFETEGDSRICFVMGQGAYWYQYEAKGWNRLSSWKEFGERCLDYYCSVCELQQKSILTFLWFWNRAVGVRDVGVMIEKMVWEEREDNLVKSFG
jgi:hypothetical protein